MKTQIESMKNKIRTVFIGTPQFSVPGLMSLAKDGNFEIVAVICGQDKKVGREHGLKEPAVKVAAKQLGLKVLQPLKIKDIIPEIESLKPDVMVVIAYGQMIPKAMLEIPAHGCINVHGSLLPKYRGASCIQGAIMNMDHETGVTIMKMDEKMDTGPIILQEKIAIGGNETAEQLYARLSELGGSALPAAVKGYVSGELKAVPQDDGRATYVKIIKKEDGRIDWSKGAEEISAFIRAMTSWPGAFSFLEDKMFKIIEVSNIGKINKHEPGTIFEFENKLFVQTGKNSLQIEQVQLFGKRVIPSSDFIKGYSRLLGKKLL